MKKCTYLLSKNGLIIIEGVTELELDLYLKANILDYLEDSDLDIRYRKGFLDLISDLDKLNFSNHLQLIADRQHAKEAIDSKSDPSLEGAEKYSDGYTSILAFSEGLDRTPFDKKAYENSIRSKANQDINSIKKLLPRVKNLDLSTLTDLLKKALINLAIEYTFKLWDYMEKLGKGLHYIMDVIFNPKIANFENLDIETIKKYILDNRESLDLPSMALDKVDSAIFDKFIEDIRRIKQDIFYKKPGKKCKVYTNFVVLGDTKTDIKLRGKIDLMAVYEDGTVDIYDLKISTSPFEAWDISKTNTYNYQLGFYKRLLETLGISYNDISLHLIPVLTVQENGKVTSLTFNSIKPIVPTVELEHKINSLIEVERLAPKDPIAASVEKKLTSFFPANMFTRGIQKRSREYMRRFINRTIDGKWAVIDPLSESKVRTFDTEEEAEKAISDLQEYYTSEVRTATSLITSSLANDLEGRNASVKAFESLFNKVKGTLLPKLYSALESRINAQLQTYKLEMGWKVLKGDEFIDMGVIVLYNTVSKKLDIITISNADLLSNVKLDKGDTILGHLIDSSYTETLKNNMKATVGNVEIIKGMSIADELLGLGDFREYRLNTVKSISTLNPTTTIELMMERTLKTYDNMVRTVGLASNKINLVDSYERILDIFNSITNYSNNKDMAAILNCTDMTTISVGTASLLIDLLLLVKDSLFYTFFKNKVEPPTDSLEYYLYTLVSTEIAFLGGIGIDIMNEDPIGKYNLGKQSFKNRTFANSTELSTSDTIPLINPIHLLLGSSNNNITRRYTRYKHADRVFTDLFKRLKISIGNNKIANITTIAFSNLLDTSELGRSLFRVKNPDTDLTLSLDEKTYLIKWLKDLNEYRYPELKGVEKDEVEFRLKGTGLYFEIPMMLASKTSKVMLGRGIVGTIKDRYGLAISNPRESLDSEDNTSIFIRENKELDDMFNIFDALEGEGGLSYRAKKLAEGDPYKLYETNLEEVKDTYVFSKIRQEEYNEIIPLINAALVLLNFATEITGRPSLELYDFIIDFMNSTVFKSNLIKGEDMKSAAKLVGVAKSISSVAILGGNFLSGIKETATGLVTLYNRAIANTLFDKDKINISEMTKAYTYVWVDAIKLINNITMLEYLNRVYRMSNMDIDAIVEELNYLSSEAMRFSHWVFWFNRAPDFLHRMTIFMGYMVKYGCLDAYSVDGDDVVYDWRKDKRFELLASGDLSNLIEYNNQRALYNRIKQQFLSENKKVYDKETDSWRLMTEKDELPDAFTELEANRARQEANTMFGYMDNDTKSLFYRRGIGVLIGQFKTFVTAKKNQWVLTRKVYGDGKWVHIKDLEGNLLYLEDYDDNGRVKTRVTTTITDKPVWDWEGKITEGILWSMIDLVNVLNVDNLKKAWKDPIKKRNLLLAMNDLFMILLLLWVMSLFTLDEAILKLDFGNRAMYKVIRSMKSDLSPWETFTGLVDFEFTPFKFFTTLGSDVLSTTFGDDSLVDLVTNNFGVMRPFKKELKETFDNQ